MEGGEAADGQWLCLANEKQLNTLEYRFATHKQGICLGANQVVYNLASQTLLLLVFLERIESQRREPKG